MGGGDILSFSVTLSPRESHSPAPSDPDLQPALPTRGDAAASSAGCSEAYPPSAPPCDSQHPYLNSADNTAPISTSGEAPQAEDPPLSPDDDLSDFEDAACLVETRTRSASQAAAILSFCDGITTTSPESITFKSPSSLRYGREGGSPLFIPGVLVVVRPCSLTQHAVLCWVPLTSIPAGSALLGERDKFPDSPRFHSSASRNCEARYAEQVNVSDITGVAPRGRSVTLTYQSRDLACASSIDLKCCSADAVSHLQGLLRCLRDARPEEADCWREFLYSSAIRPSLLQDAKAIRRSAQRGLTGFLSRCASAVASAAPRAVRASPGESELAPVLAVPPPHPLETTLPVTLEEAAKLPLSALRQAVFARGCEPGPARGGCWARLLSLSAVGEEASHRAFETLLARFATRLEEGDPWAREQEKEIAKDVTRTDREQPEFGERHGRGTAMLQRLLRAYCLANQHLGYVQGMSDIAAVSCIVMGMDEEKGYACFTALMERLEHRFDDSAGGMRAVLSAVLAQLNPALHAHLYHHDPDAMFSFRWLFLMFKREFPLDDLLCLWDALLAAPEPFEVVVAAALLQGLAPQLQILHSLSDILQLCQSLLGNVSVRDVLRASQALWHNVEHGSEDPFPAVRIILDMQ